MKTTFAAYTLIIIIAAANSQHAVSDSIVTEIIRKLIDENRGEMINVNIPEIDMGILGAVSDVCIHNLENFAIDKLEAPGPLSVDISNATISLNNASATANFNFVDFQIPPIGLIVNGAGDLTGYAEDIMVTVALHFKLKGLGIELIDFTGLDIKVRSIKGHLANIENEAETNAIINAELANFISANLFEAINKNKLAIIALINQLLSGILY